MSRFPPRGKTLWLLFGLLTSTSTGLTYVLTLFTYRCADLTPLCQELGITVSELMDGEVKDDSSIRVFDEKQILDMLERIQRLEKQKISIFGILLIVMGIALLAFSQLLSGTDFKDFMSGVMIGISVGEMLAGVYVVGRSFAINKM